MLYVALARLMRKEITTKATNKHGIMALMDTSTFYDTISLERLQQALHLAYPPLALELAIHFTPGQRPSWLKKR